MIRHVWFSYCSFTIDNFQLSSCRGKFVEVSFQRTMSKPEGRALILITSWSDREDRDLEKECWPFGYKRERSLSPNESNHLKFCSLTMRLKLIKHDRRQFWLTQGCVNDTLFDTLRRCIAGCSYSENMTVLFQKVIQRKIAELYKRCILTLVFPIDWYSIKHITHE